MYIEINTYEEQYIKTKKAKQGSHFGVCCYSIIQGWIQKYFLRGVSGESTRSPWGVRTYSPPKIVKI